MSNIPMEILVVIFVLFLSTIILVILFYIIKSQKDTKYSEEYSKVIIESMRDSFERNLYTINERLMKTEERWKDVNHLLISSQKSQDAYDLSSKKIHITQFLKSHGIEEKDLIIDKKLVFVLTPFSEYYEDLFIKIKEVCDSVGFKCIRGDEDYISSDLLPHIIKGILKSSIIIANVDGRNPNVFYELGISHALDKKTIILSRTVNDLPVDLKSKRVIVYESLYTISDVLKDELVKLLVSS
jgi:hypothetical protein